LIEFSNRDHSYLPKCLPNVPRFPVRKARQAGYPPSRIARMISTPSDVYMFSRLPEADQRAVLRRATDSEFERYVTHAEKKLRGPMRQERTAKRSEGPPAATHSGARPKTSRGDITSAGGTRAACGAASISPSSASAVDTSTAVKRAVKGRPIVAGEPIGRKVRRRGTMAVLCKQTGHVLPYRCGDCRGYCIERVGMTIKTCKRLWKQPAEIDYTNDTPPL
jgi:hypothetical protein